jgi:hypothetical protein
MEGSLRERTAKAAKRAKTEPEFPTETPRLKGPEPRSLRHWSLFGIQGLVFGVSAKRLNRQDAKEQVVTEKVGCGFEALNSHPTSKLPPSPYRSTHRDI